MAKAAAIFQEKSTKTGSFIGNRIYYYQTKNSNWWFVSVGKPHRGEVPKYTSGASGQWVSRKTYPTLASIEKLLKGDNIYRVG